MPNFNAIFKPVREDLEALADGLENCSGCGYPRERGKPCTVHHCDYYVPDYTAGYTPPLPPPRPEPVTWDCPHCQGVKNTGPACDYCGRAMPPAIRDHWKTWGHERPIVSPGREPKTTAAHK